MTQRRPHPASWIVWSLLTAVSGGLYALIARVSSRFEYTQPFVDRPIPVMVALLGAAFAVYLLASLIAARWAPSRGQLGMIAGAALLYRLILLPTPPIQEVDIYRYLWDGIVVSQGINPFRFPPQAVREARLDEVRDPRLASLVQVRDADPHVRTLLARIHYAELPSVYPPVSQAVFAAAAWMAPTQASIAQRILILKIWLLGFDLATGALVLMLLRETGRPLGMFVLYAWCPLVLKEFSNSGHLDVIAVFLTTLAMWLAVRSAVCRRGRAGGGKGYPPRTGLVRGPPRTVRVGRRFCPGAGGWRQAVSDLVVPVVRGVGPAALGLEMALRQQRHVPRDGDFRSLAAAAGCSPSRAVAAAGQPRPPQRSRPRLPPPAPIPAAACGPS